MRSLFFSNFVQSIIQAQLHRSMKTSISLDNLHRRNGMIRLILKIKFYLRY